MIRGTTAQFKFKLPYTKSELAWATIKFWQPGNPSDDLPITRTLSDCSTQSGGTILCVSLTATDTALFLDKYKAKVQLRAQHSLSGTVFGSRPQMITVYPIIDEILDDNEIEEPEFPEETDEGFVILDGKAI